MKRAILSIALSQSTTGWPSKPQRNSAVLSGDAFQSSPVADDVRVQDSEAAARTDLNFRIDDDASEIDLL